MTTTLFKFGRAAGIADILDSESIFITSPLDLNDPFEMRPSWTNAHEERFRINQETRNKLAEGAPLFAAMEGGKLERIGSYPAEEPQPKVDVANQYGIADLHHKGVFGYLHERLRILSWVAGLLDIKRERDLSDEKATLMWAHYADSFQGACIAVDPALMPNGLREGGFEISYDPTRRQLPPDHYDVFLRDRCTVDGIPFSSNGESGILIPDFARDEVEFDQFLGLLTAKSPAWSYENEIRFIYDLRSFREPDGYLKKEFPCEVCRGQGKTLHECTKPRYRDATKLPAEAVQAIIFAVDTHPSDVERILKLAAQDRYGHVRLFWSSLHSEHYQTQYSLQSAEYIAKMQRVRNRDFNSAKGNRL